MRAIVLILISLFTYTVAIAQPNVDTFHLYFDLNVPTLNKNIERKIDLLIFNDKIISGSKISIIGYADFLGTEHYNKELSLQRAVNTKAYLVKYGLNAADIMTCVGKGEVRAKDTTDAEGNPDDRRVDIVVNYRGKNRGKKTTPFKINYPSNTEQTVALEKSNQTAKGGTATASKVRLSRSDSLLLAKKKSGSVADLNKMKEGQIIVLKNVYFPLGSHIIKPESYETLEQLYKILTDNPTMRISIEGHVCCIQEDEPDATDRDTDEPMLSYNRAKAIYNYLVRKGISEDRLQFRGFGKRYPIVAFERTEEDAELNRRVEIRIIGK